MTAYLYIFKTWFWNESHSKSFFLLFGMWWEEKFGFFKKKYFTCKKFSDLVEQHDAT